MNKTIATGTLTALLTACLAVSAQASEPSGLDYSNIGMTIPDYDEPFRRDGVLLPPDTIRQVVPGLDADGVRRLLGDPVETGHGERGPEWDYNLKLDLADEDFIVCQYKVLFDAGSGVVVETAWRRYQCRDAMSADSERS